MESAESASVIPFRSKKPILQAARTMPAKLLQEDRPAMLETPEKSIQRNQNVGVKRTARMLLKEDFNGSDSSLDLIGSTGSCSVKRVERSVNFPEKNFMLCEFFNVMVSVIPLLRMRRKVSSFTNICPKIESVTERRFTVNHLAQLKYILPEVIVVKRIHARDEQTECMKEELVVTLDIEAVKVSKNTNDLKELFRSRIEDYYNAHLEENDIPEADLPALFYQPKQTEISSINKSSCATYATHVPQSFQRKFSVSESSSVLATPIKDKSAELSMKSIDFEGTPVKEVSTPIRLMANTPVIQHPPKRCYMSPDDVTCDVPNKLVRRAIRTRSLKFDYSEDSAETKVQDDGIKDFVSENILESVRENERKILEEQDLAISQARRRHQLMSDVPKLFDMIHLLFQSIDRSVMTKEELLYKIISGHTEIIDRGEVEEQFELLQELTPEYIYERVCPSGDTLVCVNKSASAQSVRAKLLMV